MTERMMGGECRLARQLDPQRMQSIEGTAARFYDGTADTEYRILGKNGQADIVERVLPGAFDEALKRGDDVVALFNHDLNWVLGRTPDTLKLELRDNGLHYEIMPSRTNQYREVGEMIQRGDIRGSSFQFAIAAGGEEWSEDGDDHVREISNVQLVDVSPVIWPAFGGTDAIYRSASESRMRCTGRICNRGYYVRRARMMGIKVAK